MFTQIKGINSGRVPSEKMSTIVLFFYFCRYTEFTLNGNGPEVELSKYIIYFEHKPILFDENV